MPEIATPHRTKLSAVIACYRDEPAIPFMYQRLRAVFERLDVDYEIIFVNDCSPDNARAVLADLAARDPHVVVVNHARNFGSQAAFTSGMKLATGDAVVLLDGDLQDPPELIEDFVREWRNGFQVVYGVRVRRETSWLLGLAYKAFYRVFRRLAYVNVPLDAGDFSLLDRRVVEALNTLPEANRFIRGLRAWVGFRQTGVPYVRPERMFGRSTNNWLKNLGWARKAILSFSYKPIDIMTWVGAVIVLLAFLGVIGQFVAKLVFPELAPTGFTTLIMLILLMGGFQILTTSVLGCYLAHIYDEVKRRPPYIVESIWNAPGAPGDDRAAPRPPLAA